MSTYVCGNCNAQVDPLTSTCEYCKEPFESLTDSLSRVDDAVKTTTMDDLIQGLNENNIYTFNENYLIPEKFYLRWFTKNKEKFMGLSLDTVFLFGRRIPQPSRAYPINLITKDMSWVGFNDTESLRVWLKGKLPVEQAKTSTKGLKKFLSYRQWAKRLFYPRECFWVKPAEL